MFKYDASVIVLTYNSDYERTIRSIRSALIQKDVSFEIIVSDDGSEHCFQDALQRFFEAQGFSDYKLLRSETNQGTVKNYLAAVNAAEGEFLGNACPGDYLFDAYALHDFVSFCRDNGVDFCFGNSVYYTFDGQRHSIYRRSFNTPSRPVFYNRCKNSFQQLIAFGFRDYITGTSYFRKTAFARTYISSISDFARYAEDTASTLNALANGERITYYDRNLVWYEYGAGISTSGDAQWYALLEREFDAVEAHLAERFPDNRALKAVRVWKTSENRYRGYWKVLLRYPDVILVLVRKKLTKRFQPADAAELNRKLQDLLTVIDPTTAQEHR